MMSYKMAIMLLLLFVFLIVMYREILNLREELTANLSDIKTNFNDATVNMTNKLQSNMIHCVSKIKDISTDNLQQLRKISMLNRQQVTKVSNHFTESDSVDIDETQCLSAKRKAIFHPKDGGSIKESNLYMSESENEPKKNTKQLSANDIDVMNDQCPLPNEGEVLSDGALSVLDEALDNNEHATSHTLGEESDDQIEVNLNEVIDNDISMRDIYVGQMIANNVQKQTPDLEISGSECSESNDSEAVSIDSSSGIEDNIEDADGVGIEIQIQDKSVESNSNEGNSLKDINDYNIHTLRQVAKDNQLPITHKNDNGQWKTYNKHDLYEFIKLHLANKITNVSN
jgi:hypothetical protein